MPNIATSISDTHGLYTLGQIAALVELAKKRGYSLEPGSYLESMTVKQLDRLGNERYDA